MLTEEQKRLNGYYGEASDDGVSIEFDYDFSPEKIVASAYIFAPKRGDEALELLAKTLQQVANEFHLPVEHKASPLREAAEALFKRNKNYQKITEDNEIFFQRVFQPDPA